MGALRLIFGLFFSMIGLFGYAAFDYTMANRAIVAGGGEPIGFYTYAKGWAGLIATAAEGDPAPGEAAPMTAELIAMLPLPPPGWTMRPATDSDAAAFVPAGLAGDDLDILMSALTPNPGRGVDRAVQTYQNGPSLVVVELVRYPDMIFTSFGAMGLKMELQMAALGLPSRDFMAVRGLEVREAVMAADVPARVFLADVGGQIHLRVLAPGAMTDMDLLPFFQTLHVPAMNADVVEKVAGMGEVPVIVLASVIDADTRAAREAEHLAAEQAAAHARAAEEAAAEATAASGAEAEAGADAAASDDAPAGDDTAKDGVTVRKGLGKDNTGSTLDMGNCRSENGRKVCGALGASP